MRMFESNFKAILANFTSDQSLINKLWTEVIFHYNKHDRHYHTLQHLDHLLKELSPIQDKIADWQVVVLAIAYHDIIYNPLKQDNEEKSAALAHERLNLLNIAPDRSAKCKALIAATKSHSQSTDSDINYFIDADLAILGNSYFSYKKYTEQIRKEYSIYPDILYKPGRQKVLQHFLQMPTIYKTMYFIEKYEQQARNNIAYELQELQK